MLFIGGPQKFLKCWYLNHLAFWGLHLIFPFGKVTLSKYNLI